MWVLGKHLELLTLLLLLLYNQDSLYQTNLCKLIHCCICQDNIASFGSTKLGVFDVGSGKASGIANSIASFIV